jgi:hypothetical protein
MAATHLTCSINVENVVRMLKEIYPTSRFTLQNDSLPLHITAIMLERMVVSFSIINEAISTFKTEEISLR